MAGYNNINVNRLLTGATVPQLDVESLVINQQQTGIPPSFQRGIVREIIYNPKSLSATDKNKIKDIVINPEQVDQIAANSVIATIISDGVSDATPSFVLLAPFFQSHIMLPVQLGEQVTIVFEDFQKYGIRFGKWMTRTSEGLQVEDPNFTHSDRRFLPIYTETQKTSQSLNRANNSYTPTFPNGGETTSTYSLPQNNTINPYDLLYRNSITGSLKHQYEVVPRWTKRPQEFVIQGMNNSLIMLGQDRVGYVSSESNTEQKRYAGTIDMVTGRGRYKLLDTDNSIPNTQQKRKVTSPLVVKNSRNLDETDKIPKLNGRLEQLNEGDPNFIHDAARIYISMNTLGDTNFRTQKTTQGAVNNCMQGTGINYSLKSLYPVQFPSSSVDVGNSYIVNKADHIRLIARRNIPSEDNLLRNETIISGSILILKEGKNRTPEDINAQSADKDHMAYMYLSPEGRIQIDGMQIFLGGAALRQENQNPTPDIPRRDTGFNSELSVGSENQYAGLEPYIKWSEFKNVVEGLQRQIDALQNAYSGLVDALNRAPGTSVCIPANPDTAWVPLSTAAKTLNSSLSTNIATNREKTNKAVYKSRSAKIFGQ
jgi:hypothetical protein